MPGDRSVQENKCTGKKVPELIIAREKMFQGKIVPEEEVPGEISVRIKKVP